MNQSYPYKNNGAVILAVLIALCAIPYVHAAVSPVLYSANDTYNNTIMVYGNPQYNYSGNYYSFDGVEDYTKVTDTSTLRIKDNISVSAWVMMNSYDSGHIISRFEGSSGQRQWALLTNGNKVQLTMGNVNGSTTAFTATSSTNMTPFVWYQIGFTYSTGSQRAILYVNGVNEVNGTKTDNINDTTSMSIYFGIQGGSFSATNASITEVRIYNNTLSSSEMNNLYSSGRNYNSSLLSTGLVLYEPFNSQGNVYVTGQNSLSFNLTYLNTTISDQRRINWTSPNIYEIHNGWFFQFGNNNFSINNEQLRMFSNASEYAFINSSTGYVNITNSQVYSWNGSAVYSSITNRRSYIYSTNAMLNIVNSSFKYLGYDFNNKYPGYSDEEFLGFTCRNCDNSLIHNNTFSFNSKAPFIWSGSDNLIFSNNTVFNNTGNGTSNTAGIIVVGSNNIIIENNTIYNIKKGIGWSPDDAAGIQLYGTLNNATIRNNLVHDAETGIATFYNTANVSIFNNSVYDILGSAYKMEDGNSSQKNLRIYNNNFYNCGNTGRTGYFRPAIEIDSDNLYSDDYSAIYNNTIWDCAKAIFIDFANNVNVYDNNIINISNISLGTNGFPSDSNGVQYSNGSIGFWGSNNITLSNNTMGSSFNLYSISLLTTSNITYYVKQNDSLSLQNLNSSVPSGIVNAVNSTFNISGLIRSMVYFRNGTAICYGSVCGTLLSTSIPVNDLMFVLNSYNVTQGYVRLYDPITVSAASANVRTITSTLTSTITNVSVTLSTSGVTPSTPRITYPNGSSEYPSYLYDSVGGTITFDATIPPGVSVVTLNDAQAVVSDICFGNAKGLDSIGSSLPVFGGLFVLIVVVGLLGGLGVVSLPLGIGWREIVVGLVVLVGCMVVISFLGGVLTPVPC